MTLGQLFSNRKETGFTDKTILSVTIEGEVLPREELERSVIDRTGTEKYYRTETGDIVYNTMRMWQGSCGVSPCEGLVSPAYTVLQPTEHVDSSDYWNFAFHSRWMLDVFTRFSVGVASDRWRLYYRDFHKLKVNVAPVGEQRKAEDAIRAVARSITCLETKIETERKMIRHMADALLHHGTPKGGGA